MSVCGTQRDPSGHYIDFSIDHTIDTTIDLTQRDTTGHLSISVSIPLSNSVNGTARDTTGNHGKPRDTTSATAGRRITICFGFALSAADITGPHGTPLGQPLGLPPDGG
eukprot:2670714-Pyramimonas_sp.AAC.1